VQWLGVVDKIATFPHFSEGLRRTKEGDSRFLELKKLDLFARK